MDFHNSKSVIWISMLMVSMALMCKADTEDSETTTNNLKKLCFRVATNVTCKINETEIKCSTKNRKNQDTNSRPYYCELKNITTAKTTITSPSSASTHSSKPDSPTTTTTITATTTKYGTSTSTASTRFATPLISRSTASTKTAVTSTPTPRTTPVATSHSSPLSTTSTTSTPVPRGLASEPSKSAVIGGAVGAVLSVAVVVVVVLLAVWIIRRRNARHHKDGTRESREYTSGHDQMHADGVENPTYQMDIKPSVDDCILEKPSYEYIGIGQKGDYQHRPYVKTYPLGTPGDEGNTQNEYLTLESWPPMDETYNRLGEVTDDVSASHNVYNRINTPGVTTSTGTTTTRPCLK
ncbi:mucin-5B-like isoform X2 [Gigantopelta aegis]|uniref:mucin-5B-like isoform X2 n=1 Tax=Gigantopelta aegis TaxID=1735272 RepID=UPI001B88C9AF|nr:mucin-5B-like isoform X2 [Gigantopelta aegis]